MRLSLGCCPAGESKVKSTSAESGQGALEMPHQEDSARASGSNLLLGTQLQHRVHSAIPRLSNCAQALAGFDHPRNYIACWSHVRETQLHRIGSNQHFTDCGDVGSLSRGQPAAPGMLTSGVRPGSQLLRNSPVTCWRMITSPPADTSDLFQGLRRMLASPHSIVTQRTKGIAWAVGVLGPRRGRFESLQAQTCLPFSGYPAPLVIPGHGAVTWSKMLCPKPIQ